MLSSILVQYFICIENESKNQTTSEAINITVPAFLRKSFTLSNTSFKTYFKLGNLYSGYSDMYDESLDLRNNFFIISELTIIIIIDKI